MNLSEARKRLIVALDVPTEEEALELFHELKEDVEFFKIGLQLFTLAGPRIVRSIIGNEGKVFLDLKLHDIPNTVASAVREAAGLRASLLTLHTSGGETMLRAARESADQWSQDSGEESPGLLGVTILTSLNQKEVDRVGFGYEIDDLVVRLARLASDCRLDGIVSSPLELKRLKQSGVSGLLFVTPGIRPASSSSDDQTRIMTPARAIAAGSSYMVIGRPIIRAESPAAAARSVLEEIRSSSRSRGR